MAARWAAGSIWFYLVVRGRCRAWRFNESGKNWLPAPSAPHCGSATEAVIFTGDVHLDFSGNGFDPLRSRHSNFQPRDARSLCAQGDSQFNLFLA
ncbi:MAG: hypothetical protein M9920_11610 [Verrucomicrobiae bacterium]|nr:hypothetical protein [Verrucomicrobiae bacterium]